MKQFFYCVYLVVKKITVQYSFILLFDLFYGITIFFQYCFYTINENINTVKRKIMYFIFYLFYSLLSYN